MPRRTRDDEPPPELPPPAEASPELADETFATLPPATASRAATTEQAPPLRHCTEAELLSLMSMQQVAPEEARDAWAELYRRHSRYVAAVASRALRERGRDDDAVFDLVGDAFQTVFDWTARKRSADDLAGRFDADDAETARRKALGLLAAVTRRLAARRLSNGARAPREVSHAALEEAAAEEKSEPPPGAEHSKLEAVLALLSSDEAEALRVSLPWYSADTGEFTFPRGEAARIAASLGITPEALRQRRSRSIRRLQALLRRP